MTITTRRIRSGEGELLKRVRLGALLDSPSAFGRTHEEESQNGDDRWAELAAERSVGRDHCTFFAVDGERVVGLVGGHRGEDGIELVSMWADPNERGRGVGAALVETGDHQALPSDPCKDEIRMRLDLC